MKEDEEFSMPSHNHAFSSKKPLYNAVLLGYIRDKFDLSRFFSIYSYLGTEIELTAESNIFFKKITLNLRGKLIDLSTPRVMGVLNVTPDSFYDGGKFSSSDQPMLTQAEKMLREGATIIDIGGYDITQQLLRI